MAARRERWLDQTSLNVIRFVIGSYLCAVALGLPSGYDPLVIFGLILPMDSVAAVGSLAWLTFAGVFIFGFMLRATTLILAALVISSTIATYLMGNANFGDLWQSLAFAASLLLCYASLRPYEMYKAALFPTLALRGGAARAMQKDIMPRRVTLAKRATDKADDRENLRRLRPVIAPTEQMIGMSDRKERSMRETTRQTDDWPEDDIVNIFANH